MRLELTGRHVEIVPAVRQMVDRKLAKLERLLDHRALSAQVVLTQGKRLHRVDVTLHTRGEKFLHAVGEAPTWDAAMGQAVERIQQQAQRVKGKWEGRKRSTRPEATEVPPAAAPAPARSGRTPVRRPRILRTTRQVVRPLAVADAARRLDSGSEDLVVFRDTETDAMSVLYRTADGELVLVLVVAAG